MDINCSLLYDENEMRAQVFEKLLDKITSANAEGNQELVNYYTNQYLIVKNRDENVSASVVREIMNSD